MANDLIMVSFAGNIEMKKLTNLQVNDNSISCAKL